MKPRLKDDMSFGGDSTKRKALTKYNIHILPIAVGFRLELLDIDSAFRNVFLSRIPGEIRS